VTSPVKAGISPGVDVCKVAVTVSEATAVMVFVAVSTLMTVLGGGWLKISPITDVAKHVELVQAPKSQDRILTCWHPFLIEAVGVSAWRISV
jgi:hypothetical protein